MVAPFLLVVVDEDEGAFCVEGPMRDDRPWNSRVCAAQDAGRRVRCFTSIGVDPKETARAIKAQFGWTEVDFIPLPLPSN
jgi:hypothetical protein